MINWHSCSPRSVDPRPGGQCRTSRDRVRRGACHPFLRQTRGVYFRWAANTRARKAITSFAHNARMQDDWAAALYADARARGKRNPHATASSPAPGSA